jgi:uncharacterized protein (DUF1330 family)
MSYEILVGLKIKDPETYQKYREAMMPILQSFGGDFGYDFWIKETLKTKSPDLIDRLFTLNFPDKAAMESFFAEPRYLEVKKMFFESSVSATTIIASYSIA